MRVSVVCITYNWPAALTLQLQALARQSRMPDEVIVTDDGSDERTAAVLRQFAGGFPTRLVHLWQPDDGFRAARARNRGIAAARGELVVLLDGDIVPHRHLVADHARFARRGCFQQGQRVMLDEARSARALAEGRVDFDALECLRDPGKALRLPWLARARLRERRDTRAVMSCNQSYWRDDLLAANGFDEAMHGWGYEDTELAARLLNRGIAKLSLKFCAVAAHLHHRERCRGDEGNPNRARFDATCADGRVRCEAGIDAHRDLLGDATLPITGGALAAA